MRFAGKSLGECMRAAHVGGDAINAESIQIDLSRLFAIIYNIENDFGMWSAMAVYATFEV